MPDGHIAEPLSSASVALDAGRRDALDAARTEPAHAHGEHPALDKLGIGVSITCAIHCIASALLGVVPALAGRLSFLESMELPMLLLALVVGTASLVPAARAHHHRGPIALFALGILVLCASRFAPEGGAEIGLTVAGFTPVATAHLWNLRLCHH